MTFTLEHLEFYLLILMRVSGFIMTAPFFSYSSVPMRIRAAMSVFMSLVVIQVTPVVDLTYSGVFGYSALVLKESMIGVVLGLMCSMCFYGEYAVFRNRKFVQLSAYAHVSCYQYALLHHSGNCGFLFLFQCWKSGV